MTTWKDVAEHYYYVAVWFATHNPGTPVPEWCWLQLPKDPVEITELIDERIKDEK
jgi:hypothetical protein